MNSDNEELIELLEDAIVEKGAIAHMQDLDRRQKQHRRAWFYSIAAAAACIILFFGVSLKLGHDAQTVGYAFNPVDGQMGGSEITALMQNHQIAEARVAITEAREKLAQEIENPSSSDPEYMEQLSIDSQELDLLDAVCLLREGRYFKAKKALQQIVKDNGAFASDAQSLLEAL